MNEKTALLNGATVRAIRALTEYNQQALTEMCGFGHQRMSQCELGNRCFSTDEIRRICDTLGVDETDFYKLRKSLLRIYDDMSNRKHSYTAEL